MVRLDRCSAYPIFSKKSQPVPTGILSGLGEGLAMDDYGDMKEWFTFKKKSQDPPATVQSELRAVSDDPEER